MKKILSIVVLIIIVSFVYIGFFSNVYKLPEYSTWETQIVGINEKIEGDSLFLNDNGKTYIEAEVAKEKLGIDILCDRKNKTAIFYDGKDIYRLYNDGKIKKNTEIIKLESDELLLVKDKIYVGIDFLLQNSSKDYCVIEELNRLVYLDTKDKEIIQTSDSDYRVRASSSVFSEVVDIVKKGELYFEVEEKGSWNKIITSRGSMGYISDEKLSQGNAIAKLIGNIEKLEVPIGIKGLREKQIVTPFKKAEYDKKLNITWNQFVSATPASSKLNSEIGIDIIIPTWFSLKKDMTVKDIGKMEYMEWAKNNGYEVWILVNNGFDPDLTSELLNNSLNREKFINSMVEKSIKYGAKGINIDFEDIYLKDKDMLTQFTKELYPICKEAGLVLSIDVTFKSSSENWSLCYDRKELAKYVDFIMIMAYDQHWASGGVAGPVSSISWVEKGLKEIFNEVSNNQIILGIPFYTRVWEISPNNKIKSTVYSMDKLQDKLKKENAVITYDEKTKLNYAEYFIEDRKYVVWIEDLTSINNRIDIMKKYNLVGVAGWKKGFENKATWNFLKENLNN